MRDLSTYHNDVWSSSDGKTWTRVTANAPWGKRAQMVALVFTDPGDPANSNDDVEKIWILGGLDGTNRKNDVWSTTDGKTWSQATPTNKDGNPHIWSARSGHAGVVYKKQMWILGGNDGNSKNDVWSTADGKTWKQITASASWKPKRQHAAVSFNNRLWVLGGYLADLDTKTGNDPLSVWSSTDGSTWQEESDLRFPEPVRYVPISYAAVGVYRNRIWGINADYGRQRTVSLGNESNAKWVVELPILVAGDTTKRNPLNSNWVLFKDRMWVLGGNTGIGAIVSLNSIHSFGPPQ